MKTITLSDFLTDKEIALAWRLEDAQDIAEKIIKPNIERINRALGQENDPLYLGYCTEYVIRRSKSST